MRRVLYLAPLLLWTALPAAAELQELCSRYVQVLQPQGPFAQRLIRLAPPAAGPWKEVGSRALGPGARLWVPPDAQVDGTAEGSRVLQVVLAETTARPRPV